jgi:hypothetical protein
LKDEKMKNPSRQAKYSQIREMEKPSRGDWQCERRRGKIMSVLTL